MDYVILVTVEGMEQIAKGGEPYSWQLNIVLARDFENHPEVYIDRKLVGRCPVTFPSAAECIAPVLAKLKKKEQEIQAEAYEEMMKVKERREQILALTMTVEGEVE